MNNLLFTALLIILVYYFFYYLPQQKQLSNPLLTKPLTHSQTTQTNPILNIELEQLKQKNQQLEQDYRAEMNNLQKALQNKDDEIRELVKRPLKPTNSKSIQTDSDLENTLDTLIKEIQDLNNSLD